MALLLFLSVPTFSKAATNDTDPGRPTFNPQPQPLILINTEVSGQVQSSTWLGNFVAGTNYRITVTEQGWTAAAKWKVRHDWLEREVMRERAKNYHLKAINEIDRKQIKSLKWDALGGKILTGVIVVVVAAAGTYAILKR